VCGSHAHASRLGRRDAEKPIIRGRGEEERGRDRKKERSDRNRRKQDERPKGYRKRVTVVGLKE